MPAKNLRRLYLEENLLVLVSEPLCIENFDFSDCNLSVEGIEKLISQLALFPNLTKIVVGNNGYDALEHLIRKLHDLPHSIQA